MWMGLAKLFLWLITTLAVTDLIKGEKVCPDQIQYYCACSFQDTPELKEIKMCSHQNLEKADCRPCPDGLQKNINCSCPGNACPICSLHNFGVNGYNANLQALRTHDRIYYIQDSPSSDRKQNSEFHPLMKMMKKNNSLKSKKAFREHTQDKVKRGVDAFALNLNGQLYSNRPVQFKLLEREKPQMPFRFLQFPQFMNDKDIVGNPLSVDEKAKNTNTFELPFFQFGVPYFRMSRLKIYVIKVNDSKLETPISQKIEIEQRNLVRKKFNADNGGEGIENNKKDNLERLLPFEVLGFNLREDLLSDFGDNIQKSRIIVPRIGENEYNLNIFAGDKCYFKSVPDDSDVRDNSKMQTFSFQCSVANISSRPSPNKRNRDVSTLNEEIEECFSVHSTEKFNVRNFENPICNVSLPQVTLLKYIKFYAEQKRMAQFKEIVIMENSNLTDKIEFNIKIVNSSLENFNQSDNVFSNDENSYKSLHGKLKIKIRIYLKKSPKRNFLYEGNRNFSDFRSRNDLLKSKTQSKDVINIKPEQLNTQYTPDIDDELKTYDFYEQFTKHFNDFFTKNYEFDDYKSQPKYRNVQNPPHVDSEKIQQKSLHNVTEEMLENYLKEMDNLTIEDKIKYIVHNNVLQDFINYLDVNGKKSESLLIKYLELIEDINIHFKKPSILNSMKDEQTNDRNETWTHKVDDNALDFTNDETENNFLKTKTKNTDVKDDLMFLDDSLETNDWLENWIQEVIPNRKINSSDAETQSNVWLDNLPKSLYSNNKLKFSDYEDENNDRFEYWLNMVKDKQNFPLNDFEEDNWLENTEEKTYSESKFSDERNTSTNSFENYSDKDKQSFGKVRENSSSSGIYLTENHTERDISQKNSKFTLKRVYRDSPNPLRWLPQADIKNPDIFMKNQFILKLLTSDFYRTMKGAQNLSDILWFQYRKYILIPNINKSLKGKTIDSSDIFTMLNMSTSALKRLKIYNSSCVTCSLMYKLMLDQGLKDDPKLVEGNKSSIMVLMSRPQFAYHPHRSLFPFDSKKKSGTPTKDTNASIIRITVDLLFLTSDDYQKLDSRNIRKDSVLRKTPWRDLRKKFAFRIPENFSTQSGILNLRKLLKHKSLNSVIRDAVYQDKYGKELQKVIFAVLSKMHEHKTVHKPGVIKMSSLISSIDQEISFKNTNRPSDFKKEKNLPDIKEYKPDIKEQSKSSQIFPKVSYDKGSDKNLGDFRIKFKDGFKSRLINTSSNQKEDKAPLSFGDDRVKTALNLTTSDYKSSSFDSKYMKPTLFAAKENEGSLSLLNINHVPYRKYQEYNNTFKLPLNHGIQNFSNGVSRIRRDLRNSTEIPEEIGVTRFQMTDRDAALSRRRRDTFTIPHNHWCTIQTMRRNGNLDCTMWTHKKKCTLVCHSEHSYEGKNTVELFCRRRDNVWKPDINKQCRGSGGEGGSIPGRPGGSIPGRPGGSVPGRPGGSIPGSPGGSMPDKGLPGGSKGSPSGQGNKLGLLSQSQHKGKYLPTDEEYDEAYYNDEYDE